jgi:uncharacterized protein (TIGR02246 family)
MTSNESDITAVGLEAIAAWNAHDMSRFARLFCEDAEFVNVYGSWWTGRERIEAEHVSTHASVFRKSRLSGNEIRVKFLRPDVASLHIRWDLVELVAPDGSPLPARNGVLVYILVRNEEGWRIAVGQNTDVIPLPG